MELGIALTPIDSNWEQLFLFRSMSFGFVP